MKKTLLFILFLSITYFSKAQLDSLSYADGVKDAVEKVNLLKATLLNHPEFYNWGYTVSIQNKEFTAGTTTVSITTYSYLLILLG